jgi:hypothetical protein
VEEKKKTGITRVDIENVLTQHGVRVWRTDIYVTHTTKPDTCFGVRQVEVLVCDETKQTILIVDLTDFLVCKYVGTFSLPRNFSMCLIQKYMNKTRHVTYELPCTHDKYIQIDRQKCVFLIVGVQVRWQFFSLWHTLRTCVCETWIPVQ